MNQKSFLKETSLSPASIQSIHEIISHFDLFFVDIWGVIHNGFTPYPKALEALSTLKEAGKIVYLVSNAPRRIDISKQKLIDMGVSSSLFDGIFTSGEDCHQHLLTPQKNQYKDLGQTFYHLGPVRDQTLYEGIPFTKVDKIEEAAFIINTGILEWEDTIETYSSLLEKATKRNIPMVCANMDQRVMLNGREVICAGAIARFYEQMGNPVFYHGKPLPSIYAPLLAKFSHIPKNRILMIGDSLQTDIKGANNVGIQSLMVLSGVHHDLQGSLDGLQKAFEDYEAIPDFMAAALA